jgi:hypothetical protein
LHARIPVVLKLNDDSDFIARRRRLVLDGIARSNVCARRAQLGKLLFQGRIGSFFHLLLCLGRHVVLGRSLISE